MNAWGDSDKGRVRKQNQDSHYLDVQSEYAVLIVCDGMGGAKAGNIASRLATDTVSSELKSVIKPNMSARSLKQALELAIYHANRTVWDLSKTNMDYKGMGTTLVCAVITARAAYVANIGDSRAYIISDDGIRRVTRDHSVVEDLLHQGTLTDEEARAHPKKNLITRVLGTEMDVACDIYEIEPKPGDFLLLCSDGLTNIVDDQEILYEVIHGGAVESCCNRLVTLSNTRGGPDNITVALLSV
ncbi:MAG: Stp1/IreP family PP2C-type Ser/Thr phosphatase [Oscillospiraceae bacterium]|nr:Stp1/IreP family PP2C-type Ser/Thr phosphatase [Oscillospiraceae bacterium]